MCNNDYIIEQDLRLELSLFVTVVPPPCWPLMRSSTFIAPKHVQAFDTLALDAMIKDPEVFPPFYAATAIRSNLSIFKPPMTHSASYQLQQYVQIFDAISKYRCSDKSSRPVRFRRSHRHLITSLDSCINGDASNVEFGIIAPQQYVQMSGLCTWFLQ